MSSRAQRATRLALVAAVFAAGLSIFNPAEATRIQELVTIEGVRDNQLVGYGLVAGLNGTGDSGQARFTVQSVAATLRRLNVMVDPQTIQTKNVAAVLVTATLPPFASPGTTIDITISSIGNARSLQGGTLIQAPLLGADRQVYAVAQGPVLLGGFSASGGSGSSSSSNHVTAGRLPGGAIVERRVESTPNLAGREQINLLLRDPNFTTANRIVDRINAMLGAGTAIASNGGMVQVNVPASHRDNPVALIAQVHALDVTPNSSARIVVNERTGTVVVGSEVRISEVAIAQGGLSVEITEAFSVSQPNALGGGGTAVVPETGLNVEDRAAGLQQVAPNASLADVVSAINALGATPRDLISILTALKAAGALQAEIIVQ